MLFFCSGQDESGPTTPEGAVVLAGTEVVRIGFLGAEVSLVTFPVGVLGILSVATSTPPLNLDNGDPYLHRRKIPEAIVNLGQISMESRRSEIGNQDQRKLKIRKSEGSEDQKEVK